MTFTLDVQIVLFRIHRENATVESGMSPCRFIGIFCIVMAIACSSYRASILRIHISPPHDHPVHSTIYSDPSHSSMRCLHPAVRGLQISDPSARLGHFHPFKLRIWRWHVRLWGGIDNINLCLSGSCFDVSCLMGLRSSVAPML